MSEPAKGTRENPYTSDEWFDEGKRRFGPNCLEWRFVCPICDHVAAMQDWKDAGAPATHVGYSCVGCWIEGSAEAFTGKPVNGNGPCNYSGLYLLNPIFVRTEDGVKRVFDFAETVR